MKTPNVLPENLMELEKKGKEKKGKEINKNQTEKKGSDTLILGLIWSSDKYHCLSYKVIINSES